MTRSVQQTKASFAEVSIDNVDGDNLKGTFILDYENEEEVEDE